MKELLYRDLVPFAAFICTERKVKQNRCFEKKTPPPPPSFSSSLHLSPSASPFLNHSHALSLNTMALELTQCLSLVGVGKPSCLFLKFVLSFQVLRGRERGEERKGEFGLSFSLLSKKKKLSHPFEDVPLVPVTFGAADLRARHPARRVLDPEERSGDLGVEGGPAAARVELRPGLVQLGAAPGAVERTFLRVKLVVLSRARGLGAGLAQDVELILFGVGCEVEEG